MTSRLTETVVDCADPAHLAEFWCAALGYEPAGSLEEERASMLAWFASRARIVVSSHATLAALDATFAAPADRFGVIALSGEHAAKPRAADPLPAFWWGKRGACRRGGR